MRHTFTAAAAIAMIVLFVVIGMLFNRILPHDDGAAPASQSCRIALAAGVPAQYWRYACENNAFEGEGLKPECVAADSFNAICDALQNETADGACITLAEFVRLKSLNKKPFKICLATGFSNGAHELVAIPAVGNVGDIKGRKTALVKDADSAHVLGAALYSVAMSQQDIAVTECAPGQAAEQLRQNKTEIAVLGPAECAATIQDSAFQNRIYSSTAMDGGVASVLVFSEAYVSRNPGLSEKLARGWDRAQDAIASKRETAFADMARNEKIEAADFARVNTLYMFYRSNQQREAFARLERALPVALKALQITGMADDETSIANSLNPPQN